jgi:membrane-bound lytic murein transglycosylase D
LHLRRFPVPVLLVSLGVLLGSLACRSGDPSLSSSVAPEPPSAPVTAAPAPEPSAPAPAEEATPAPPEPAVEETPPAEEPAQDEDTTSEPDEIQKEALEACQSAEELLGRGETDLALAAVDHAYELMLQLPGNGDDAYLQAKEDLRILAADLIGRIYKAGRRAAAQPAPKTWDLALPIVDNQHVQREIQSLTGAERQQFLEGYRRSGLYRPMILARLEKAGLPSQLSWLPLVESWFKVRALSRASALGMWQFISSTGVRYGLSRDNWVDERLDPEKATDAAIAYLTDLHGLFGDWPKALAAYNCGEARVLRLSRQSSEYLDFWDLYEMLPRETRRYVPRLFAALQIIEDPAKYGMELPNPEAPSLTVASVRVDRSVRLDRLEAALELEAGTLQELNPELRHHATPKRPYDLRVPAGREETVLAGIASVPEWTPPVPQYVTHRVRSGETLSQIARRYGTSVSVIMRANGLRSANRLRIGQRLRIPVRGAAAAAQPVSRVVAKGGKSRYEVRSGDTLGRIAHSLGVSLQALLAANGLGMRSTIHPGQWLVVP